MEEDKEYEEPWERQRDLQKKYAEEEVPSIEELRSIIQNISYGKVDIDRQTRRAKALFAMYYLTACRVSEIVMVGGLHHGNEVKDGLWKKKYQKVDGKYKEISKELRDHTYEGIKKGDIKFEETKGKPCMYVRTENRKHKTRQTKRQPIPIELEQPIVQFVKDYIKNLNDEDKLFAFRSKSASKIITSTTGFNVHFIRHIRATHLVTLYDFNEQALIKFMGWTDARPAKNYMELSGSDILMQFYKNK